MVLALAGRRIDSHGAKVRVFPYENAEKVQGRIAHLLQEKNVRVLVCSAACGADILALEAAEHLKVRRRVVLPFEPEHFRETSVVDRPGDWGARFDQVIAAAQKARDLVELGLPVEEQSYVQANYAILAETLRLASESATRAGMALVWDGQAKEAVDYTVQLGKAAREHGLGVFDVSTL